MSSPVCSCCKTNFPLWDNKENLLYLEIRFDVSLDFHYLFKVVDELNGGISIAFLQIPSIYVWLASQYTPVRPTSTVWASHPERVVRGRWPPREYGWISMMVWSSCLAQIFRINCCIFGDPLFLQCTSQFNIVFIQQTFFCFLPNTK